MTPGLGALKTFVEELWRVWTSQAQFLQGLFLPRCNGGHHDDDDDDHDNDHDDDDDNDNDERWWQE